MIEAIFATCRHCQHTGEMPAVTIRDSYRCRSCGTVWKVQMVGLSAFRFIGPVVEVRA